MIPSVSSIDIKNTVFGNEKQKDVSSPKSDMLLPNNFSTRSRIALDKFTKAFTVYPARGLKGNINSDFYEFLTMGTVPYIIGSATLMSVFNSANKYFSNTEMAKASKLGNKMALGVLFYAFAKSISKSFVDYPVKWITGVDTQLPYLKVYHQLPETKDDFDLTSYEYHKVGESVEFTRWDLLYGDPNDKKTLNERFDKIAKKNGLGENLNDSDQEVKPIYKEILVKSTLARSFSSYLWAACGVALAFQKPWDDYFKVATLKFWKSEEFCHSLKVFVESLKQSAINLYKGPSEVTSSFEKHAGKGVLALALSTTLLGVLNTVHISKKPSNVSSNDVMDKNKESVVG
ncbi:hypothetical protein J6G99_02320 [bacterium]|nr:hypothetical protein [bacterium]